MHEDSGLHKPALATGQRGAVPSGWGQIPRDFLAGKIRELQDDTPDLTAPPPHTLSMLVTVREGPMLEQIPCEMRKGSQRHPDSQRLTGLALQHGIR